MLRRILHTKGGTTDDANSFSPNSLATTNDQNAVAVVNTTYLPGAKTVGWGYDVWGRYADTESTTLQLIDWSKVPVKDYEEFIIPDIIDVIEDEKSYYSTKAGSTITEIQEKLNSSTNIKGKYNFFSGSLSANFDMESTQSAFNSFSYMIQALKLYSIVLDVNKAKAYLKDDVKNDINNLPASVLFDKYGTHFLSHVNIGARATMSSSVNKTTYKGSLSLEVATEISYQSLTMQLSGDNTTKYSKDVESFKNSSQIEIVTIGGDATKGGQNIQTDGGFKAWEQSVRQSPVFIDFGSNNALTAIWDLCDDPARANELANTYYPAYAEQQSIQNQMFVNAITDVCVVSGDNSSIQVPTGYIKCPGDLNEGAKGKFIYIGYKLSSQKEIADKNLGVITGLTVVKDKTPPSGYTLIDKDLNEKAGGDFLYLCYKREDLGDVDNTLKSIMTISADYPQIYPPVGYERIGQDCNSGAKGKFVYVCYSKTV